MMDMIRNSPERPSWEHVRAESAEVKALWSQYANLKIRTGTLLRRRKNQGIFDDWQIVAPQTIRTRIFQACHHHKLAAHQGVVRTLSLIKRRFYWPNMQKDVEAWCQRCAVCGKCKAIVRGHGHLQQPIYGTFNERVSLDLMGPFKRTQVGNEYIVVMQDVALWGQRLLAYGERLWREEIEAVNPAAGRARHPARPRRPTARQQWLEVAEGQMPAPPAAVGRDDARVMGQPRPLRAEARIYVEPPGAFEIGRRPLDLNAGPSNVAQNGGATTQPMHLRREAPVYEDHYRAATEPRTPHRA